LGGYFEQLPGSVGRDFFLRSGANIGGSFCHGWHGLTRMKT